MSTDSPHACHAMRKWKQLTGLHMLVNGGSDGKYGSAESGLAMHDRAAMYARWIARSDIVLGFRGACHVSL
jgi:hypothetical protein